jgi:hypothetical protein
MSEMTKDEALKKANELASTLGQRWSPDVWQNLDWHYGARLDVSSPGASVELHGGGSWSEAPFTIYVRTKDYEVIMGGRDALKLFPAAMKELERKVKAAQASYKELATHLS